MKLQNMENPESDGGSEETPFFQDQRQSGLHCDHDNRRNHSYPEIILGTFGLNGFSAVKTILNAYRCGYRALDTSSAYGNERFIGMALSLLFLIGGSRKDLFVETKVSNAAQRRGDIYDEVLHQIKILRCGTLDMLLLHWPYPELYQESWKQMERLYRDGVVKQLGVCNFHRHHLEKLLETAEVVPAVDQVERHPLLTQKELHSFCSKHDIVLEAYSPVGRMHPMIVKNRQLLELAGKYHCTVPQLILKWNIQGGVIPIPKAGSLKHLRQNIEIGSIDISEEDMALIDAQDCNFRVRYNPDICDMTKL